MSLKLRPPLIKDPLFYEYPRTTWQDATSPHPTVRFLLARHRGFRNRLADISENTRDVLGSKLSPPAFCVSLAQELHYFIPQLEGHHLAESQRLYPSLIQFHPAAQARFETLESDHKAIDTLLAQIARVPEDLMNDAPTQDIFFTKAKAFATLLSDFESSLLRHLEDEEDLVVPILLKMNLSLEL